MNKRLLERILIGLALLLALAGSYFGIVLPAPELPPAVESQAAIRERISIDAVDDAYLYNGAGLYVYSDDHSTRKHFIDGATGDVTMGSGAAADSKLVYDGNAQDFYVALDDSADDLLLGLGSTVGTTGIVYLDENQDVGLGGASAGAKLDVTGNQLIDGAADEAQLTVQGYTTQTTNLLTLEQSDGTDKLTVANSGNTDVAGTLQYGANNLYPVGYTSSGQQLVYGTASVTGTATAAHGLTTVTFCSATLGEDPTSGAGDAAMVTVSVSANVCTLKVWQDDFVTAATETGVAVHWIVVGAP